MLFACACGQEIRREEKRRKRRGGRREAKSEERGEEEMRNKENCAPAGLEIKDVGFVSEIGASESVGWYVNSTSGKCFRIVQAREGRSRDHQYGT